ncbi:DUF7010 family protein [Aliikangiella sp. IMCC44632]
MQVIQAQADMRAGYFGGAPGLIASGVVWLCAGVVGLFQAPQTAILSLFFGGMLIHPVAVFLTKILGRKGSHQSGNPLASLAIESTFLLFIGMLLAFSIAYFKTEWFFAAMLLVIGGRYFTFATLYGDKTYWACAVALIIAGVLVAVLNAPIVYGAFAGGLIELVFAGIIFKKESRQPSFA